MKNAVHGLGDLSKDLFKDGLSKHFWSSFKTKYGVYKTKNPMKEQMKQHKMTEREIFEKYDNLNENEQHTKNNKEVYAKTDVMTTVIQRSRGEKKDAKEK